MSVIPGCTCSHPGRADPAVIWHDFDCAYRLREEERMATEFRKESTASSPPGPPQEWADREARARKRRVQLRDALWSVSRDMNVEEIEEYVSQVIAELRADEE